MFFPEYDLRLRGIAALRCVTVAREPDSDLITLGQEIGDLRSQLASPANEAFGAWGELLRCIGHLLEWSRAIREAELDADRHLRAARQRARDVARQSSEASALHRATLVISEVAAPDDVQRAAIALLRMKLPLPVRQSRPTVSEIDTATSREPEPPETPLLAFLQFYLGEKEMRDPHELRPNLLYDLRLQINLSAIPESLTTLEVTPYTVEPVGIVDAPAFVVDLAARQLPLSCVGRLRVQVAQDALARPLEITYGAQGVISGSNERLPIKVHGQSTILLRCVDETYLWRAHEGVRAALVRIRDSARLLGVADSELSKFLELLGAIGQVAADALATNMFPGDWPEERFHDTMRLRLRSDPSIGSVLEDHPNAGGGITDLSFHRIRLELKIDSRSLGVDEAFADYGQQLAQYVAGSDRRTGVLAILCAVQKGAAPAPVENDISLRVVQPPTGGDRGIAIGVVLVRANLQNPSLLSRRRGSARRPAHKAKERAIRNSPPGT